MARRPKPKSQRQYVLQSPALEIARELPGVRPAPVPEFVAPCLATLTDKSPSAAGWVHEIKWDGYRAQIHASDAGIRIFTRRGHDWAERFRPIAAAAGALSTHAALIDGEVVADVEGGTDFGALQDDLGAGRMDRLRFYAFDLLHLESLDLRGCTLVDRKRVLAALLAGHEGVLRMSEHLEAEGAAVLRNACALGLEGVVSKRADARYSSGRSAVWMKVTCRKRESFRVVGWAEKAGQFDGLYLGRQTSDGLEYAGKVEQGFTYQGGKSVVERLRPLLQRAQALSRKVKKPKAKWVRPDLIAEVEYRAITAEGKLRHPSFKGLREDLE